MDAQTIAGTLMPGKPTTAPRPQLPPPGKSVLQDIEQTRLAIEMIGMGARLHVLESEVSLPRVRLVRLYKELCGVSPPKGMLPFSTDWFVTWRPNAHASMLLGAYRFMTRAGSLDGIRATLSSFRIYREHMCVTGEAAQLSFTRAWMLVRSMSAACCNWPAANAAAAIMSCAPTMRATATSAGYACRRRARARAARPCPQAMTG